MELPFDLWDKIYEKCGSFQSRRKLYEALPASYRAQYPKTFIIDGNKCYFIIKSWWLLFFSTMSNTT